MNDAKYIQHPTVHFFLLKLSKHKVKDVRNKNKFLRDKSPAIIGLQIGLSFFFLGFYLEIILCLQKSYKIV